MKKSREQLKTELMGKFEEALDRVFDWQEAHPKLTLTEIEDFVLGLREEMGEEVAEAVLGQLDSKQVSEVLRCETCGRQMVYKGQESKYVETRLGGLEIQRGRYWCPYCERGIFPPG
jgi:DNA-directed RNA polymerase subunit RPC12/RpoP